MRSLAQPINGKWNLVPLKIELQLFTQIAILVDKYQCSEVVRLLPLIWKKELLHTWTQSWTNIACWICIAWQFKQDDEFLKATQLIQEQCVCSFEEILRLVTYSLPIPIFVASKIEPSRLEGIGQAVQILNATTTKYQSSSNNCNSTEVTKVLDSGGDRHRISGDLSGHRKDCDSMVLGSLIKSAIRNDLFPLPRLPYTSWSLKSFTDRVALLEAHTLCFKMSKRPSDEHEIISQLLRAITAVDKSGLTLTTCGKVIMKT
ncbi:hypothetical protein OCU04_010906 [Sclerotinia nivalis]|uniref:Uncharacterized protein n=1 Tax=Sclerotinia nivalis TaxID=352851 RepID=A0A9X0AD66_9HELO|nr:hypothetical protein OCU04_010906 [Sclerotinia nivalis]